MTLPLDAALLREKVADFLAGRLSLDDFDHWFVVSSFNIAQHVPELVDVVTLIGRRLTEHLEGHLSDEELTIELRQVQERMR